MRIHVTFSLLILIGTARAGLPGNASDGIIRGPFFSGTILAQYPARNNVANRGVVVSLGAARDAHICYDMDLMRVSAAWTGGFLNFGDGQTGIIHPKPQQVQGRAIFGTAIQPGWGQDGRFADPRPNQMGRLPTEWAKYRGLYVHGWRTILSYTVGETAVLELSEVIGSGERAVFIRNLEIAPHKKSLSVMLSAFDVRPGESEQGVRFDEDDYLGMASGSRPHIILTGVTGDTAGARLETQGRFVFLQLPPSEQTTRMRLHLGAAAGQVEMLAFLDGLKKAAPPPELKPLTRGGDPRWKLSVDTRGIRSNAKGAYVVDHVTLPDRNPWNAKLFVGGFDFLSDGRVVLGCFHGDVWIGEGIDDGLRELKWRRFATGLFQPLGVKVVDGEIFVICRDQITRLHDLNNDGEADFYECFNNDTVVTPNYHEFCMDLQTDAKGNFYFTKGAPWPPTVQSPHQGTMLKVSRDGSTMEVLATGFRAPNGMAIGPNGWITVSDNQGHWMPASKLSLVKPGGFYGMMQTAHRDVTMDDFSPPMLWLPMQVDSSSGGQVWATSEKWGPLKNRLLFTSYGRGTLFHVMTQEVDGVVQAAAWKFPLRFPSGTMRGRINPSDGQLYVSGLKGWQTSGLRNGALSRVRYTGEPFPAPLDWRVTGKGIELEFAEPLDRVSVTDTANWSLEHWNYIYSGNYGSAEVLPDNPRQPGRATVSIVGVELNADGRTVLIRYANVRPIMQFRLRYRMTTSAGTPMDHEMHGTIHKVPNN